MCRWIQQVRWPISRSCCFRLTTWSPSGSQSTGSYRPRPSRVCWLSLWYVIATSSSVISLLLLHSEFDHTSSTVPRTCLAPSLSLSGDGCTQRLIFDRPLVVGLRTSLFCGISNYKSIVEIRPVAPSEKVAHWNQSTRRKHKHSFSSLWRKSGIARKVSPRSSIANRLGYLREATENKQCINI